MLKVKNINLMTLVSMKKQIHIFILIFTVFILSSCNDLQYEEISYPSPDRQESFEDLICRLDSLNKSYGYCTTKSGHGREFTRTAADIAGAALGIQYGAQVGAWIGSAAGPCGSIVGFLVGRRYGSVVGSQTASLIGGLIYDYFSDGQVQTPHDDPYGILKKQQATATLLDEYSTYGEIHNALLDLMRHNGKTYLLNDGSIDIAGIYNDAVALANSYGIEDELCEDQNYISYMNSYFSLIESVTHDVVENVIDSDDYEYIIKSYLINEKGWTISETNNLFVLISSLSLSDRLEDDQIAEYEENFEEIVEDSALSDDDKIIIGTIGSVTIHSNSYWYGE